MILSLNRRQKRLLRLTYLLAFAVSYGRHTWQRPSWWAKMGPLEDVFFWGWRVWSGPGLSWSSTTALSSVMAALLFPSETGPADGFSLFGPSLGRSQPQGTVLNPNNNVSLIWVGGLVMWQRCDSGARDCLLYIIIIYIVDHSTWVVPAWLWSMVYSAVL